MANVNSPLPIWYQIIQPFLSAIKESNPMPMSVKEEVALLRRTLTDDDYFAVHVTDLDDESDSGYWGYDANVSEDPELYAATEEILTEVLKSIPRKYDYQVQYLSGITLQNLLPIGFSQHRKQVKWISELQS